MSKTETIISKNVNFLCLCEDVKEFLTDYEKVIKDNMVTIEQMNLFNEHFGGTSIIPELTDFISRLDAIIRDPETRKVVKSRKQIKLTPEETTLVYTAFDFADDLDSVNFRGTELEYPHYWLMESYKDRRFYDMLGMARQFIETYDVVNCKTILEY